METNATRWQEIRRGALAIIAATQRSEGLWFLDTGTVGGVFTPKNTQEYDVRVAQHFGTASITVSWLALAAWREIFGRPPTDERNRATHALEDHCRSSNTGAYGTWKEGWRDSRQVFESPRHSAIALVWLIQFESWIRPYPGVEHGKRTVEWLVSQTNETGGWREQDDQDGSTQDFSTAAVVAALCLFLARFKSDLNDAELAKKISDVIRKSLTVLDLSYRNDLWKGLSSNTQFADSAFIIEMLLIAHSTGMISGQEDIARLGAKRLFDQHLNSGWGESLNDNVMSMPSTICVLSTLNRIEVSELFEEDVKRKLISLTEGLAETIFKNRSNWAKRNSYWKNMTAWDWLCLARLSNLAYRRHIPNEHEIEEFGPAEVSNLRNLVQDGQLTRYAVRQISPVAEWTLLYLLSYGRPESVPSGGFTRWFYGLPPFVQFLIVGLPSALLGVAVDRTWTAAVDGIRSLLEYSF